MDRDDWNSVARQIAEYVKAAIVTVDRNPFTKLTR